MSTAVNGVAHLDAAEIKGQAAGRWREILPATTGISTELLDGKGHPCPACSGTDRFSSFKDFAETGGVICRNCHASDNGDGLSAVMHFAGVDFPEAVRLVAEHLGLGGTTPARNAVSRPSTLSTSTQPHGTPGFQAGSVDVDAGGTKKVESSDTDDEAELTALIATMSPAPVDVYRYYNRHGALVGAQIRLPDPEKGKTFRSARREGNGTWSLKAMPAPRPLYRTKELARPVDSVLVVEGEKDVESAESIGMVATTWSGGSNAIEKTDFSLLAGRQVVLVPDNDDAGRTAMTKLVGRLAELRPQPRVQWLNLATKIDGSPMNPKGDLTDWIDTHGDAAEPETIRDNLLHRIDQAEAVELAKPKTPLTWQPFPADALPEVVRHFSLRGSAAIGCDPVYVLMPTLVVCAALIGTCRAIELKRSWKEVAVIWAGIVGESGTQKTPAFNVSLRWLKRLQWEAHKQHSQAMAEYEVEHKRYEKELADWRKGKGGGAEPTPPDKPAAVRYLVSDATIEALIRVLRDNPSGVLSASDELSGWFGSFDKYRGGKASSDAANWLSMFNAGFVQSDRVTTGSQFVSQAAVSIVGGIQPGILRRVLSDEHRESGLAARMLLVCPPRRAKRWTESDMPEAVERRMEATFEGLRQLQPTSIDESEVDPVIATLSPDAKASFVAFVNKHGAEASELSGDLSAAWSKLEAYAARFALVFHYIRLIDGDLPVDADDNVVDFETMQSALAVVEWLKHETRRVYAMFGETDDRRELRELAEWIGTKGGELSQSEIQRGRRDLKTSAETEAAINKLVEAEFGHWFTNPPSERGGRAARGFRLEGVYASTQPAPGSGETAGSVDVDRVDKRETAFDDWSDGSDRGAA